MPSFNLKSCIVFKNFLLYNDWLIWNHSQKCVLREQIQCSWASNWWLINYEYWQYNYEESPNLKTCQIKILERQYYSGSSSSAKWYQYAQKCTKSYRKHIMKGTWRSSLRMAILHSYILWFTTVQVHSNGSPSLRDCTPLPQIRQVNTIDKRQDWRVEFKLC